MYYNLYSQDILTKHQYQYEKNEYYLQPHGIDITDLVDQYKLVTNRNIVDKDTYYSTYRSYLKRNQIDNVYFIYDNNDPEYGDKYYVLRNYTENSNSTQGLFAIIKKHNKRKSNRGKFSLTTDKIDYDVQKHIYAILLGLCFSFVLFGNNTILQFSMIIPAIISLMGLMQAKNKVNDNKDVKSKEDIEIIGFRTIQNIDVEIISKALDLGYEDRIRAIFYTPEEYLEEHLATLKEKIDIAYDHKASQLNPYHYIENYSLQEMSAIKEIEESSQNK